MTDPTKKPAAEPDRDDVLLYHEQPALPDDPWDDPDLDDGIPFAVDHEETPTDAETSS